MSTSKNRAIKGCVSAALCEILFGLSYLFTKEATVSVSAVNLLSWRFLIAFIAMSIGVLAGVVKINIKGRNMRPLLLIAAFQPGIYFIAETLGISATTASESGSFLACIPIATLIASSLILGKKPKRLQIVGICITLAGVLCCVFAKGMQTSFSVFGYSMLLLAVVVYSLYCVFVEKAEDFTDVEKTYVMVALGAIVFTVIAVVRNIFAGTFTEYISLPIHDSTFLIAILYQGLGCSVLAFFLSNTAIDNIGTNRTASFVGISTVVSVLAGVIILGESFSLIQAVGTVMILGGVYVANNQSNNKSVS